MGSIIVTEEANAILCRENKLQAVWMKSHLINDFFAFNLGKFSKIPKTLLTLPVLKGIIQSVERKRDCAYSRINILI